jgi:hypothetical protein
LEVHDIIVGAGRLDVTISRHGAQTVIEHVNTKDVDVVLQKVEAPLWGIPPK